jgi:hypothetical protein
MQHRWTPVKDDCNAVHVPGKWAAACAAERDAGDEGVGRYSGIVNDLAYIPAKRYFGLRKTRSACSTWTSGIWRMDCAPDGPAARTGSSTRMFGKTGWRVQHAGEVRVYHIATRRRQTCV